jgi:hypothetical protein
VPFSIAQDCLIFELMAADKTFNLIGFMQFWRSSLKVVPEMRNEIGGHKHQEIAQAAAAPTPVN